MSYPIDERNPAAEAKWILTSVNVREVIADLIRLEVDRSSVVVKFPDM